MTNLLIARHGNTFAPGDLVVRAGLRTDLPLVESGRIQAQKLGTYLHANKIKLAAVFTSTLIRTIETAQIALETAQIKLPIKPLDIFNEIDYGPDEAKTDQDVIARIGQPALSAWDTNAIVPPGWLVDPQQIISNWHNFASDIAANFVDQSVLVVTSNGIARFAPHITNDFASFSKDFKIKLATGSISALSNNNGNWQVDYWNLSTTI